MVIPSRSDRLSPILTTHELLSEDMRLFSSTLMAPSAMVINGLPAKEAYSSSVTPSKSILPEFTRLPRLMMPPTGTMCPVPVLLMVPDDPFVKTPFTIRVFSLFTVMVPLFISVPVLRVPSTVSAASWSTTVFIPFSTTSISSPAKEKFSSISKVSTSEALPADIVTVFLPSLSLSVTASNSFLIACTVVGKVILPLLFVVLELEEEEPLEAVMSFEAGLGCSSFFVAVSSFPLSVSLSVSFSFWVLLVLSSLEFFSSEFFPSSFVSDDLSLLSGVPASSFFGAALSVTLSAASAGTAVFSAGFASADKGCIPLFSVSALS